MMGPALILFLQELIQMRMGKRYYRKIWNLLDFAHFSIFLIFFIIQFKDPTPVFFNTLIKLCMGVIALMKIFYFLRAFN
jgi:hypothetical protein